MVLSLVVWNCCNVCYVPIDTTEYQFGWDGIVGDKSPLKSETVKGKGDLVGIFHTVTHDGCP